MSAGMLGYIVGGFMVMILIPVLILIVARFVPAMRRAPGVVYGVCAALVLLMGFLSFSGGNEGLATMISTALALLFLAWGYSRDRKRATAM
jgi:hypothetical protein